MIYSYNMQIKKELLVIIPARSESKTLKNKNIKIINGHPLISYRVEAAKNINEKDKIIHLSTDTKKEFKISKKYNSITNHLRPQKITKEYSFEIEL